MGRHAVILGVAGMLAGATGAGAVGQAAGVAAAAPGPAAAVEVKAPATPAGAVLAAWLAAFDSMDAAKVGAYVTRYDPKGSVDGMLGFARQTGGFTLVGVDRTSEPTVVRFLVRDGNGMTGAGELRVHAGEPHTVEAQRVTLVPPGERVEWAKVDAAERARVIAGVAKLLNEFYVDPAVAQTMTAAVEAKQKAGAYDGETDGFAFADRLTEDLRAVSHDGHLGVRYSPAVEVQKPEGAEDGPSDEERARMRAANLRENCGFDKVEVLPRNIGYVRFGYFGDPAVCGAVAASAMQFVAHTDALIFDLRENHGGDPQMVETVLSWLFDHSVHVNDLVNREAHETVQYWTYPWVPGERMAKQPVYVLVSHATFSGGEEFTYDLQTQKRGVIVGETTGGGAHPVSGHRIDEHFGMGVPFAHPVNPVTGKDWEGTGVVPDVQVPAKEALERAEALAAEKLGRR